MNTKAYFGKFGGQFVPETVMFALYAAGVADSPAQAKEVILDAIKSGKVYRYFEDYVRGEA